MMDKDGIPKVDRYLARVMLDATQKQVNKDKNGELTSQFPFINVKANMVRIRKYQIIWMDN